MSRQPFNLGTACSAGGVFDVVPFCTWPSMGSLPLCPGQTQFVLADYIPVDLPFCAVPAFTSPLFVPRELEPVGPDMFLPDVFNCITVFRASGFTANRPFSDRATMQVRAISDDCASPALEFDFNIPCLPLSVGIEGHMEISDHNAFHVDAKMIRTAGDCRLSMVFDLFLVAAGIGMSGPMGLTGPTGLQGPAGSPGAPGADGSAGAKGTRGDRGPKGFPGDDGIGATGPSGPTGHTGRKGTHGDPGIPVRGPTGPTGPTGHTGLKGTRGDDGYGVRGPQGPAGARGPQGFPGTHGPRGPRGSVGSRLPGYSGPQGDQGAAGPGGEQGLPGYCDTPCHDGAQGDQGPKGDRGPSGYRGLQGPAGSRGPTGPKGRTGPVGPCSNSPELVALKEQVSVLNMLAFDCCPGGRAMVGAQHIGVAIESGPYEVRSASNVGARFYHNSRRVSFDSQTLDIEIIGEGRPLVLEPTGISTSIILKEGDPERPVREHHIVIKRGAVIKWDVVIPCP